MFNDTMTHDARISKLSDLKSLHSEDKQKIWIKYKKTICVEMLAR